MNNGMLSYVNISYVAEILIKLPLLKSIIVIDGIQARSWINMLIPLVRSMVNMIDESMDPC